MARAKGRSLITTEVSGPFFTSFRRHAIISGFLSEAVATVSDMTEAELRAQMHAKFRHPTGYFESRMLMTPAGEYRRVIDDPVIYGAWLEGTSKRNQSTRFKGYKIWKRTRQKMRKLATPIAQKILDGWIGGLN
jgi:hypothetical protein